MRGRRPEARAEHNAAEGREQSDPVSRRHQCRRHHRRWRRHLWRWRQFAARLEGLAEPGGIFISRTAADQVRDNVPFRIEDRGDFTSRTSRGRSRSSRDVDGGHQPAPAHPAFSRAEEASIAVLPFANMSGDESRNISPTASPRTSSRPCRSCRSFRDRPQFILHVQGQERQRPGGRRSLGVALRAGGQRPQIRQPGAHHGHSSMQPPAGISGPNGIDRELTTYSPYRTT